MEKRKLGKCLYFYFYERKDLKKIYFMTTIIF